MMIFNEYNEALEILNSYLKYSNEEIKDKLINNKEYGELVSTIINILYDKRIAEENYNYLLFETKIRDIFKNIDVK